MIYRQKYIDLYKNVTDIPELFKRVNFLLDTNLSSFVDIHKLLEHLQEVSYIIFRLEELINK